MLVINLHPDFRTETYTLKVARVRPNIEAGANRPVALECIPPEKPQL